MAIDKVILHVANPLQKEIGIFVVSSFFPLTTLFIFFVPIHRILFDPLKPFDSHVIQKTVMFMKEHTTSQKYLRIGRSRFVLKTNLLYVNNIRKSLSFYSKLAGKTKS